MFNCFSQDGNPYKSGFENFIDTILIPQGLHRVCSFLFVYQFIEIDILTN